MIVRCRKCKNSDIEAAYPLKRSEELLAYVVPLTPYQCEKCGRFLSWANPIMDRKRTIAAGVIVGVFFLFLIITTLGDPEPMGIKATPEPSPAAASSEPPAVNPQSETADDDASQTEGHSLQGDSTDISAQPASAAVAPVEVSGQANLEQAELRFSEEEPQAQTSFSPSVQEQRRRNQIKERALLEQGSAAKVGIPSGQKSDQTEATVLTSKAAEGPANLVPTPPTKTSPTPAPPEKSAKGKATAQRLSEMSINSEADRLKVFLIGSGAMQPKGFFASKNRYVVDLPGPWKKDRKVRDQKIDHPLVMAIRVGEHEDKLRIVFDLKTAKATVTFTQEERGLLIELTP